MSSPTLIEPIGLLGCSDWKPLNLSQFAIGPVQAPIPANIFAVFGTSMNAGKSTTAAGLVKGLTRLGHCVGAAKITGTGAGGDLWLMRDAGAQHALDFTDAGFPTTFGVDPDKIADGALDLIRALSQRGCTAIVIEVADGLYQQETEALARMPRFRSVLSGTFFAAGDAMGAVAGAKRLASLNHIVLGVSG
ncbi:MAG: molybdopterin guanine dinucleotide synthesis B family protein, partial [Verrucomicrobiota bacterium]